MMFSTAHSKIVGLALPVLLLGACNSGSGESTATNASSTDDATTESSESAESGETTGGPGPDITDAIFSNRDPACSAYVGEYTASVTDLGENVDFTANVEITSDADGCTITSDNIPNHDFNDGGAFATPAAEVIESRHITGSPTAAGSPTALSLRIDNAMFLNGVKLDVLAAACYGVGNEPLGQEKIGCMMDGVPWRYDPMFPGNSFGTDGHNAHTQPDGAYHYHGDPRAMYDDTGSAESGLIGFAADGFPIYGPWIDDNGSIRELSSGYTLKPGARVSQPDEGAFPGGDHDGTFIDDYEFTDAGDLDECNGMMRDGSYGYYVTRSYPWVIGCFMGTPDPSFEKMGPP